MGFPLVVPADLEGRVFHGFLVAKGHELRIRIFFDQEGEKRHLEVSPELSLLLQENLPDHQRVIKERLSMSRSLEEFLLEFQAILDGTLPANKAFEFLPASYYSHLIEELNRIGWEKLESISPNFRDFNLFSRDEKGREHIVQIQLPSNYPRSPPLCQTRLPFPFSLKWDHQRGTLEMMLAQLQEAFMGSQEFWDVMDDVDENCLVLEPEKPARDDLIRRISLGSQCSLQFEVDPKKPRGVPEFRFLGANEKIRLFKSALNRNIKKWDLSSNLRENLELVLECKLPARETAKPEELQKECGICYAYKQNDTPPEKICDNSRCSQPFHTECLAEWLRPLPSTRQSFNTLFGTCPYCNEPMSVTFKSG